MRDAVSVSFIVPIDRGGALEISNLVGCCYACYNAKGNHLPKELGWKLSLPPRFVRGQPQLGRIKAVKAVKPADRKPKSQPKSLPLSNAQRVARNAKVRSALSDSRKVRIRRADGVCRWCLVAPAQSVDHVIPIDRGGNNAEFNLVGCCVRCNQDKGNKLPKELGWRLSIPPRFFQ